MFVDLTQFSNQSKQQLIDLLRFTSEAHDTEWNEKHGLPIPTSASDPQTPAIPAALVHIFKRQRSTKGK